MQKIVILDYGMGNLHSVKKALVKMSKNTDFFEVSSDAKAIALADKIVFPGVGASGAVMRKLQEAQILMALKDALKSKKFLGICLGMQVLFETSEEDMSVKNLAYLQGGVKKFDFTQLNANSNEKIKVPHMGWNDTQVEEGDHSLWNLSSNQFYFVHSYYLPLDAKNQFDSIMTTSHGETKFISAFIKDNLVATQFHPEKSANAGLEFFENFLIW